jgi:hypothetical protein
MAPLRPEMALLAFLHHAMKVAGVLAPRGPITIFRHRGMNILQHAAMII